MLFYSHCLQVERAAEWRSFHNRPSSAALRAPSLLPPSSSVGPSLVLVSLHLCKNLCTPMRLTLIPSSRNKQHIVCVFHSGPYTRSAEYVVSCRRCTSRSLVEHYEFAPSRWTAPKNTPLNRFVPQPFQRTSSFYARTFWSYQPEQSKTIRNGTE